MDTDYKRYLAVVFHELPSVVVIGPSTQRLYYAVVVFVVAVVTVSFSASVAFVVFSVAVVAGWGPYVVV